MPVTCPICERRRGKRFCPGVSASRWAGKGKSETICSQCCGEQREVSIDCPAHCTYLQTAHRYEAQRKAPPGELAFPQVKVDQDFLEERQPLLAGLALTIVGFAKDSAVHDAEALAALDSLARSYQTLDSGLYYEQQAGTPKAQALATAVNEFLQKYSKEQQQRFGGSLRPSDALQALVFLRRLGQLEGNDRPLSRRYLEFLRRSLPAEAKASSESRLIIPGA
jgi:uncharacterized protein YggL (DUF469 family)